LAVPGYVPQNEFRGTVSATGNLVSPPATAGEAEDGRNDKQDNRFSFVDAAWFT
jgi:hypothetical protein